MIANATVLVLQWLMADQTKTEDQQTEDRQSNPTVEDLLRQFEAT